MTDKELLNNCITHPAREGASSLKRGFRFPAEPQRAGDRSGSPAIVWFCAAKCCRVCSLQAGGLLLLLTALSPLELLLTGPFSGRGSGWRLVR